MVLEVGAEASPAVLPGAQQTSVGVAQRGKHELRALPRRVDVVRATQHRAGLGQRRDHQRVPRGQALVVEPRAHALGPHRQQPLADLRQPLRHRSAPLEHVQAMLEVPALAGAEVGDRRIAQVRVVERGADLRHRPRVELALDALGVRVERGAEAALGAAHLAQRPVERLAADLAHPLLARHLPAVQVRPGQQRVVVEHLLEVRHGPGRVDGVPGEPAADLVVDPARRHRPQRCQRHLPLAAREQELDHRGGRELRRAAPAAVGVVEAVLERGRESSSSASWIGSAVGSSRAVAPSEATTRSPCERISSRRVRHASPMPSSTIRQLGIPCRGSGGKYVPPRMGPALG